MNGQHSRTFERFERGLRYFEKDSMNKVYILYKAALEVGARGDFSRAEFEALCEIAFPPGRNTEEGG